MPSVGRHGVRVKHLPAAHPGARTFSGLPGWLSSHRRDAFNTVFVDRVRYLP